MTGTLTAFKDAKYLPVEEALKQLKAYQAPVAAKVDPIIHLNEIDFQDGIKLIETQSQYILENVPWREDRYTIDWNKKLYDNGDKHTQCEWFRMGHTLPCMQTYNLTYITLYECYQNATAEQKEVIDKIRGMFAEDLKQTVMTGTSVDYRQSDVDMINHFMINTSYNIDLVGKRGNIDKDMEPDLGLARLLGTDNFEHVKEAYKWAGGQLPFILRRTKKEFLSQIVAMSCSKTNFYINAEHDHSTKGIARGAYVERLQK
jgi:hypothetical protein